MIISKIFLSSKFIVAIICLILTCLPFFWLKPGELELGGDSSRLYLYDPDSYLQATSLYSIEPTGYGRVRPDQALLPFLFFLRLIKMAFHSPYILICLLNSLKLGGSFLFMYLVIKEILKSGGGKSNEFLVETAGIVAGVFYAFSPSVGGNMQAALLTHNQVFLNPMVFYLMLRFLISGKDVYLWVLLFVTVVFSPNFSLKAPPPPFAFYPLAIIFLCFYIKIFLKKSLVWKKLLFGLIMFLGLHAFQIIPVLMYTFDPGSYFYSRIIDATSHQNEALGYFNAVLGLGKVSKNIFYAYSFPEFRWTTFAVPFIIILSFFVGKRTQKDLVLIAVFFFVTLFLTSANITQIGVEIYRKLFYIPGFGMFRVFYGQWQWIYTFFYSILFGYSLFILFSKIRLRYVNVVSVVLVGLFVYNSWAFISGNVLRTIHSGSNNMMSIIKINPDYEQALAFLRTLPDDGKIINFPFTDFGYQLVAGTNNGAYIGVSPTAYLTGKRDYSGYQDVSPFHGTFLELIKKKNYPAVKSLLSILNVKYIFYSADPKAFNEYFPAFPYSLFLESIPNSRALSDFVHSIGKHRIFERGYYSVYEVGTTNYLPHFYVSSSIYPYGAQTTKNDDYKTFFVDRKNNDPRFAFVESNTCTKVFFEEECIQDKIIKSEDLPVITYKRVNPVKYKVEVSGAKKPFVLVFLDKFHKDWKLYVSNKDDEKLNIRESYFNGSIRESTHKDIFLNDHTFETVGMKSIPENQHFMANWYANAWYITPTDSHQNQNYEIVVEMVQQRIFYLSAAISIVSLFIFLLCGMKLLKR